MLNGNNVNFGLLNQVTPLNNNPQGGVLANALSGIGQAINNQQNNSGGALSQAISPQANQQAQQNQPTQTDTTSPDLKNIFQNTSQQTGIPEDYLSKVAKRESNNNPDARAAGSSATGLFQFLPSTWANMVQKYGKQYGIGLDDIHNPQAQSTMAAQLAKDNASALKMGLGIMKPTNTDLYVAHFLGAKGALGFLKANFINPDQPVTNVVPSNAIAANKSVFLNKDGSPKTVSQVYNSIESSIG